MREETTKCPRCGGTIYGVVKGSEGVNKLVLPKTHRNCKYKNPAPKKVLTRNNSSNNK